MKLEKYKVNDENIYMLEESNGDFYSANDLKKLIFTFENSNENSIFKNDFTAKLFFFGLYKKYIVFSKEYNTIEELKSDHIEYLI